MVIQIFTLLLVIVTLVQMVYWGLIFRHLGQKSTISNKINEFPEISIVVCGFNEALNLDFVLTNILSQDYPHYELIFVDDGSTDNTAAICQGFKERFPNFRYLFNPKSKAGKKQALSLGIKHASFDWLLLIDADCSPKSPFWIKKMASAILPNTDIVLGYAPFYKKPGLLNQIIKFECALNAIQYLSAQAYRRPYAGVGRNLLYKKSIFQTTEHLISGDDDLLISAKANAENTAICVDSDSFVYSQAPQTYKAYFLQKWRHYNTSVYYNRVIQFYLLAYFSSFMLYFISIFFLIISGHYVIIFLMMFIRTFVMLSSTNQLFSLLHEKELRYRFIYLELFYFLHLCLATPFIFIKKQNW